jgi:type II secretory pathway component PulJ
MAASITAMLATVLLMVAATAISQWDRTTGRLRSAAAARMALDQMEADLEGAIFRADGNVWLAVTVLPDTTLSGQWRSAPIAAQAKPGNTNPGTLNLGASNLEDARFGVAGVWLRFFTTRADTNASAEELPAPVAIGYQIIRQNVTSSAASEQRYLLFRSEVRPTLSHSGGIGVFEAGYDLDPAASPATPYLTSSGTTGDPGNLLRPPLGAALLDNVIDFGVRFYVREKGNLRLAFPATPASAGAAPAAGAPTQATPPAAAAEHLARYSSPAANDAYRNAFPEVADIMLRVLDDEGARLLSAYEAGRLRPSSGISAPDYWWALATAHSQVFTRRVIIESRPL